MASRDSLAAGVDFLDQKKAEREAAAKQLAAARGQQEAQRLTLARYARRFHEAQIEPRLLLSRAIANFSRQYRRTRFDATEDTASGKMHGGPLIRRTRSTATANDGARW